jgi:replicative DNA helicase
MTQLIETLSGQFDRLPPSSIDAEMCMLASMMLDKEMIGTIVQIVAGDELYLADHQIIYECLVKLYEQNRPIDAVILCDELNKRQLLEEIGGREYIGKILNTVPSAAHGEHYAKIVREKALLRQLIAASNDILRDAYSPHEQAQLVLDKAEKRIFEIASKKVTGGVVAMEVVLHEVFEMIERSGQRGLETGFFELDDMMNGLQNGEMIIVAARPSMGKAQPLDAKVLTPSGFRLMGELSLGDALGSVDGAPSKITGIYPQGPRQVFRITFADGRSTECCAEHLWRVHQNGVHVVATATLSKLMKNGPVETDLFEGVFGDNSEDNTSADFPRTPRQLAAWVDGAVATTHLQVNPGCKQPGRSKESRRHRLRHLLNVDESQQLIGRFIILSSEHRREIVELARSIGGIAKVESTSDGYLCSIDCRPITRRIEVVSIEPTRITQTQCIAVSHPSHLYITDDYIVTHNTAFAMNLIEHIAADSMMPCAVFSLEMSKQQLAQRMLCSRGQIDAHKLRKGMLQAHEYAHLANVVGELAKAPIWVDDSPGLTPMELRAKARRLKLQHDVKCIMIDYMQLMDNPGVESRQQQISEISRGIKAVARELHIPVIALSQLNRASEGRDGHRPRMSDLRESGSIEQDADVIALLHREDYYRMSEPDFQPDNIAEIIIAKQRNGPTGTVKLTFMNKTTRFENMSTHADPF